MGAQRSRVPTNALNKGNVRPLLIATENFWFHNRLCGGVQLRMLAPCPKQTQISDSPTRHCEHRDDAATSPLTVLVGVD